jgi:hypothetical protein
MKGGRGLLPLLALASLLLSLSAAEGLARLYVNYVVKQGKLFQSDPVLGWRLIPDLDLERTNPDGEPWHIGTDARPYLAHMRPGDLLLLVTYSNDFIDILRKHFSGRAKPYFELSDKGLVEHPPRVGWLEVLRDRSYIWARVASLLEKTRSYSFSDVRGGVDLYDAILRDEAWRWAGAGLNLVIAYHGLGNARHENELRFMAGSMSQICKRPRLGCVALDPVLAPSECEDCFLGDGHWSAQGHRTVAHAIKPRIHAVLGTGTRTR